MTTFRDAILPALDTIRGIGDSLGLRRFTCSTVLRVWSGARVGLGSNVDSTKEFRLSAGAHRVRIRQLSSREIVASGGYYSDQDLKIGPITPPYPGSDADNSTIAIFDPTPDGVPAEYWFKIEGDGIPSGGAWYKKLTQTTTRPLHYEVIVRNTGETP